MATNWLCANFIFYCQIVEIENIYNIKGVCYENQNDNFKWYAQQ